MNNNILQIRKEKTIMKKIFIGIIVAILLVICVFFATKKSVKTIEEPVSTASEIDVEVSLT